MRSDVIFRIIRHKGDSVFVAELAPLNQQTVELEAQRRSLETTALDVHEGEGAERIELGLTGKMCLSDAVDTDADFFEWTMHENLIAATKRYAAITPLVPGTETVPAVF